jgi:membrane protein YdbS with pleckstrin-like domain
MTPKAPLDVLHADVSPAATMDEAPAARIELLERDEIVEFSIKPSPWFIAIVSAPVVVLVGVLATAVAFATRDGGAQYAAYAVSLAVLVVVLRVVLASLQWASQVYILTNRRVMRLSGILNVDIADCQLKRIGKVDLQVDTAQRVLRLGSISMASAGPPSETIVWEHVARPRHIHERLVRAIRRAQFGP